jgi:hypothetical protein
VSTLRPRGRAAGRALEASIAAADAAERRDLLRPMLRALAALPSRVLTGGGEAVRKRVVSLQGWTSIKERDEMLSVVRAVCELGARMQRVREACVLERYGDDRYEEAQLFLRAFAEEFAERRAALDDLARALSNTVG